MRPGLRLAGLVLASPCLTACLMSREAGARLEADMQALRGQVATLTRGLDQLRAETLEDKETTANKLVSLNKTFESTDKATRTNDADFTNQLERVTHEMQELRGALEDSEHRLNENQSTLQKSLSDKLTALEEQAQKEALLRQQTEQAARFAPARRKETLREGIKLLGQAATRQQGQALLEGLGRRYGKERGMGDEAHFALGQAATADKAWDRALGELVQVVDFSPPSRRAAEAYFLIGQASEATGRPEDAKTFYLEVVSHFAASPQAKLARGRLAALGPNKAPRRRMPSGTQKTPQ